MSVITIYNIPSKIIQKLNAHLLLEIPDLCIYKLQTNIIPLSLKKIKDTHSGRQREFNELLIKFRDLYERKKTEKAEYTAKIKEKTKERSCIPATVNVCKFTKMDTRE